MVADWVATWVRCWASSSGEAAPLATRTSTSCEHAAGIVEIGLGDPQPVAGGEHLEVGVGDTATRR